MVRNTFRPASGLATKTNAKTFGTTATLSAYDYTVNSIGQRTAVSRSGSEVSSNIAWDYNNRGELVEEDFGDNDSADPRDRVYRYDGIGNRQKAAEGTLTLPATENYLANAVNEYATIPGAGGAIVSPDYDDDGNATAYPLPVNTSANASLVWDAENRLIEVAVLGVTYTYEYDYRGRRIAKDNGTATTRYLYEGWNLCAEYTGATLAKTYTWGMDLSGSMQGAGGVGGLLAVTEVGTGVSSSYYPTYDGNGNVSEYLNSAGGSVAHYEYDAFGNEITAATTGAKSADFSHRFSTKYLDETGLYYYGYRYYDPVTGRWPSRDPIEELGSFNLYGFNFNNSISWVDVLGMAPMTGDQEAEAREKWEERYNPNNRSYDEKTVNVCFAVDDSTFSDESVVEFMREIVGDSDRGGDDEHEEGGWIILDEGEFSFVRWPRNEESNNSIMPTAPVPPNTVGDAHTHPTQGGAENGPSHMASRYGPWIDNMNRNVSDAPDRSHHTAIVVDGKYIYFTKWEYQCKKDGTAVKKRVCMTQTTIKEWIEKSNKKK